MATKRQSNSKFSGTQFSLFRQSFELAFFENSESKIDEFSQLAREIAALVKAIDMIIIPEISDGFIEQHSCLTVNLFRKNYIATKRSFLEVR
jgi:hypothetical protein